MLASITLLLSALTTLGQLVDQLSNRRGNADFDLTGQVAFCCTNTPACVQLLGDVGSNVWWTLQFGATPELVARVRPGDFVRLKGSMSVGEKFTHRMISRFTPAVRELSVTGHGPFPTARPATGLEIGSANCIRSVVSCDGVLESVECDDTYPHYLWLTVRSLKHRFRVLTSDTDFKADELKRLKDAEVRVSGLCDTTWGWRRFLGGHLVLFGKDALQVLTPAPADPFSPSLATAQPSAHRKRFSGTVIGIGQRDVFVRTDDDAFLPVRLADGTPAPAVGESVDVAGFAEGDLNNSRLREALVRVRKEPPKPPETPRDADIVRLAEDTRRHRLDPDYYGAVIRFSGVLNNPGMPVAEATSLTVQCGEELVTLDVSALAGKLDETLCAGCRVEVRGICSVRFDNSLAGAFPDFDGFVVIPRTAEDVRILAHPPWWTPFRLFCAICILLLVLVGILVWNRALAVLSERRGRELYRSRLEHAKAELKVKERTRLAIELHDSISQMMTGVALQIDSAEKARVARPELLERILATAGQMLASCQRELRCCIWDLRIRTLDVRNMTEAVLNALRPHLGDVELSVRFNVPRKTLPEPTVHAILRIVRELCVNAVRHGGATRLAVAGESHDGRISFSVTDNGRGFDPDAAAGPASGHFGLQGIRERLREFDGALSLARTSRSGMRAVVTMNARSARDGEHDE